MTLEDVASAKRLALGAVLVYVLWLVVQSAFSFAGQLKQQRQEQQQTLEMLERTRQREAAILRQNNENLARQRLQTATSPKAARPTANKPSHPKMPVSAVVKRLRQVNAFGLVASPERLLHCRESHDGWDYTCVFHGDPLKSATWAQFGVLVDNAHIIEVSETFPSSTPLPLPLSQANR
jgi:hypothetical protein